MPDDPDLPPFGDDLRFPPVEQASREGLIAMGGDLSPERLLAAYRNGIFPWPWSDRLPMLWWCPDPRFVLYPEELRVTRSLEQRVKSGRFAVTLDTAFDQVVAACAQVRRREEPGTWITPEMRAAYAELHRLGHAHSTEAWREGRLAGGLYGVALGGAFFGESMFFHETDASKVAFVTLVRQLRRWGFRIVDCQIATDHLARFGARTIPRARFLEELAQALEIPNRRGPWRLEEES